MVQEQAGPGKHFLWLKFIKKNEQFKYVWG